MKRPRRSHDSRSGSRIDRLYGIGNTIDRHRHLVRCNGFEPVPRRAFFCLHAGAARREEARPFR
ncbi:hypothetical protein BURMUCF1_0895 [Burkholderia multivorans ATCC BAA-247]|nr:hypothetical protein BURMUCF1_0895 [Burkholderia multivorans ATCC BAA-247]